jgi:hypothetical protein
MSAPGRRGLLIGMTLLWLTTGSVLGQEPLPGEVESDAGSEAVALKSRTAALALELLVPSAGYAYAGHWSRGIPQAVVRSVGWTLMMAHQLGTYGEAPPCRDSCAVGMALGLLGTAWGLIDVTATVNRTNARRLEAAGGAVIVPHSTNQGVGLLIRVPAP